MKKNRPFRTVFCRKWGNNALGSGAVPPGIEIPATARRAVACRKSLADEFRRSVEVDALRGEAVDRGKGRVAAHVGTQPRGAGGHVQRPREGIVRTKKRCERGVRLQIEARQRVAAAIEVCEAAQAVHVERHKAVVRAVEPFEARHRDVQPRERVAPAVEPFQTRELLQVGERRDAPFRTLHRADTLRLVARDAAVTIDVEFAQTVGLEGLVVKCQVDVSVLLVALVLGKAAGRREQ